LASDNVPVLPPVDFIDRSGCGSIGNGGGENGFVAPYVPGPGISKAAFGTCRQDREDGTREQRTL
jgi:hypothetical protein